MKFDKKKYGSTALITGASSGIGKAFAHKLAEAGMDIVLVARRKELLDELSSDLVDKYNVKVHVFSHDLLKANASKSLFELTENGSLKIDLLVNNAGFGMHERFDSCDLGRQVDMITLNCTVPLELTRFYLPKMVENKKGAIIMVSSVSGIMPIPNMATYAGTKGFVVQFGSSLYQEMKSEGVDVVTVCPGDTSTEFRDVSGLDLGLPVPSRTPTNVAETALSALGKKPYVVDGIPNKLFAATANLTPTKLLLKQNSLIWRLPKE